LSFSTVSAVPSHTAGFPAHNPARAGISAFITTGAAPDFTLTKSITHHHFTNSSTCN
jgi:hypothetical protein